MQEGKSFSITQTEVLQAYKKVKANKGAGGIDGIDFEAYEDNWKNNLYKLWNRMVSGSYFPKPVRGVEIPKKSGKMRLLGIPTIEDRIAQMVVRNRLEPKIEKVFLDDSYGYRPNKSALDAIGRTRERCYRIPWLIEFDIVDLFDHIDHSMLMKAVRVHTCEKWILLYIERFLKAPIVMPDGVIKKRNSGTPQGGVISPLLANLFMHYSFDRWMKCKLPRNPWARYADDGLVHCFSEKQAVYILDALRKRMQECKLEIHPEKSHIVYCKSSRFNQRHKDESFDFLGYTFRARLVKSRNGCYFMGFTPAVSRQSGKDFRMRIKSIVKTANTTSIERLSKVVNPVIHGWINYFIKYNPSETYKQGINYVNLTLARWLRKTHKSVRNGMHKAQVLLWRIAKVRPNMFCHWEMGYMPVK